MQPIYIDLNKYLTYRNDEKNKRVTRGEERTLFSAPAPKISEKKYRFGVIMPEKTGFFAGLAAGAEAAAEVLKKSGVEVGNGKRFARHGRESESCVLTAVGRLNRAVKTVKQPGKQYVFAATSDILSA